MTQKTFLEEISDIAEQSFGEENLKAACEEANANGPLWKKWESVWWACAKQRLADLEAEGLVKSAYALETSLRSLDHKKEYFQLPGLEGCH